MRALLFLALVVSLFLPAPAKAQVTVDMSRVTCAEVLGMTPDRKRPFSAWMSGWYNHRYGYTTVGLSDFERNMASLTQFCGTYPNQLLMAVLDRSPPSAAPIGAQIKVDMALVNCKQFTSSDAERQELIASWMSGYFHASTGSTIYDFQRFATNKKRVTAYCRKNGKETVMSAIQKSAR